MADARLRGSPRRRRVDNRSGWPRSRATQIPNTRRAVANIQTSWCINTTSERGLQALLVPTGVPGGPKKTPDALLSTR